MVALDTADLLDLKPGDRLFVSDDRQRFEHHIGEYVLFRNMRHFDQVFIHFRPRT